MGARPSWAARALLRWAVGLLPADLSDPSRRRLYAAVGALATLRLEAGDLDQGGKRTRQALDLAGNLRSRRLLGHLAALRVAAAAVPDGHGSYLVDAVDNKGPGVGTTDLS